MNYKKIIDISWPIIETMTAYKDRSVVKIQPTKTWEKDHAREALVTLGTHTGTHVDAPSHFMQGGQSIDQLNLLTLIGPCMVFDMTHIDDSIGFDDVKSLDVDSGKIVLFKTRNSEREYDALFDPNFIYLHKSAAKFLAQKNVRAVGIDYLGIERGQAEHETHLMLLEKNIPIIEGLRLGHVEPREYFLCCLPLKLQGLEAAPARAILLEDF